jgi:hypothetical protein
VGYDAKVLSFLTWLLPDTVIDTILRLMFHSSLSDTLQRVLTTPSRKRQ